MWTNFIDKIYLINLAKREDRLLLSAEQFEKYNIPYQRIEAIEDEQGARGLRDTMLKIFNEAIESNYQNILVFEDDVRFIAAEEIFNDTMNKAVLQLPENYHLFYLGGQATGGYTHFHAANILPVFKYFATQSVIYSRQGIKEILARNLDFPIDNYIVEHIQVLGHSYAVHPILCTQFAGYSDIGCSEIDWDVFITPRHYQRIAEINNGK